MTNIMAFIGFLFPPAIDLINRYVKSSDVRFWVSVLFCALVGTGVAFIMGNFTPDGIAEQALIFIGQAQLSYKLWDKASERKDLGLVGGSKAQ